MLGALFPSAFASGGGGARKPACKCLERRVKKRGCGGPRGPPERLRPRVRRRVVGAEGQGGGPRGPPERLRLAKLAVRAREHCLGWRAARSSGTIATPLALIGTGFGWLMWRAARSSGTIATWPRASSRASAPSWVEGREVLRNDCDYRLSAPLKKSTADRKSGGPRGPPERLRLLLQGVNFFYFTGVEGREVLRNDCDATASIALSDLSAGWRAARSSGTIATRPRRRRSSRPSSRWRAARSSGTGASGGPRGPPERLRRT